MLNAAIEVVAAVDDRDPQSLFAAFREVPRPDVFVLFGFRVAAAAEMEQLLTDDQLGELTVAEREEIGYRRPTRVGDVVFNWFD
jgi:hypothetical protein